MNKYCKYFIVKVGRIVSILVIYLSGLFVNTACLWPFYEPEQPKELERLKKKYK